MQFGHDVGSRTQVIEGEAHTPQCISDTQTGQWIECQRTAEIGAIPSQASEPWSSIHITDQVSGGEHDPQSFRRSKGEEVGTSFPVSCLIGTIEDQEQTASIGERACEIISQQFLPRLYRHISRCKDLFMVKTGKTCGQSCENDTSQVRAEADTDREKHDRQIAPRKQPLAPAN